MIVPSSTGTRPAQSTGVTARFAERARAVDEGGDDVRAGLRWLGERGLLDPELPDRGDGGLLSFLGTVESVARACLSSAFSLWAQRMTLEYLGRAQPTALTEAYLDAVRDGRVQGSSAMAPAMKERSGLGPVPVRARPTAEGYLLNGPVPWASNLFEGAVLVLPARVDAPGREDERIVTALRLDTPGIRVGPFPTLLALNGTASAAATLDEVPVPHDAVLSEDMNAFCASVRTTFLLVQTAFCTGLTAESLSRSAELLSGANTVFADQTARAEEELWNLRGELGRLTHAPAAPDAVTRLRLDSAAAAVQATRLESTLRGGAGFTATSPTGRRLREAAFLPIQSPTEGHLRWDLAR